MAIKRKNASLKCKETKKEYKKKSQSNKMAYISNDFIGTTNEHTWWTSLSAHLYIVLCNHNQTSLQPMSHY